LTSIALVIISVIFLLAAQRMKTARAHMMVSVGSERGLASSLKQLLVIC